MCVLHYMWCFSLTEPFQKGCLSCLHRIKTRLNILGMKKKITQFSLHKTCPFHLKEHNKSYVDSLKMQCGFQTSLNAGEHLLGNLNSEVLKK